MNRKESWELILGHCTGVGTIPAWFAGLTYDNIYLVSFMDVELEKLASELLGKSPQNFLYVWKCS